ncbi:8555_t:CDS:2 [Ambispora gerdemannii]|uniref:8555_t:CDS:1 n=1 Tax=Ambispora gerdemannii TaxID=144530 RepID=A0A9N9AV27_9GLOM|nr:8555_t:CDS:2 [Ambispora gerdemannii]
MGSLSDYSGISDELADQASGYGLPYGIFGITNWSLFFLSILLTYANCPLISIWRWGKPYKKQNPYLAIFASVATIGPIIFTCIYCNGKLVIVLMALGQLTPWSFKIMNDGFRSQQVDETDSSHINLHYSYFGWVMIILLSVAGWVSLILVTIGLLNTDETFKRWIWTIYALALLALLVIMLMHKFSSGHSCLIIMMAYFLTTIHMIGFHIILARISGNWSGIAPKKSGLVSAIIFFIGNRLQFLDF